MKIAVTYDHGQIFQHFGHTEQFKLSTVEDGKIVSSVVIDTNGSGHGALAGLLAEQKVDTLICGGSEEGHRWHLPVRESSSLAVSAVPAMRRSTHSLQIDFPSIPR